MNLTEQFNQHMQRTKPAKKEKAQPIIIKQIDPRDNMSAFQESLSKCTYGGNTVWLPSEMLPNYKDIRTALLNAGATYKKNSFVFPNDAEPYINRLMGGDKVNIKKEFQFFGTSDDLADEVVFQAQIEPFHKILEPSAGQAAIVNAIVRVFPSLWVDCCELMDINQDVLAKHSNVHFICEDFLKIPKQYIGYYDRIIANPPFSKNQDIDHIYKMYECLKPGGRIVTIASKHWLQSTKKKETAFREWLDKLHADIEEVPAGAFKESGTNIATCIIIINKLPE